ncbi:putative DNA repair protein YkoV [Legionella quinlivanii]|uniref:Non-homologous end joining protein Ku n=1 Tax=Legionella quinlivanii TaxID=45073 RepID=A0A0W0Y7Q9_9GAMM|nr:Ku protein [Legionella quinlivanii]KTD52644.1 putative DNA repair protein YkoV [Legionella quinlivanii]MCW8451473.1 Ku protein [Legionella quinlivanii]SEG25648.1 DNA end-binding protein Ku [Legionella quinlivanii DSM 21216]STY10324.1 Ku protein [Legionella quinlivanii]
MRAIWKGDISFGLVSIPVGIVSVEERKSLSFHLIDAKDHARIRYQRVNSNTGEVVDWNNVVKGYEYEKDHYVVVDEQAFEKAGPDVFKSIDIDEFIDAKEIDPLYFDKAYYIVPESKNKKAYVLLREALKKTKKAGVARVIIRTKEYLSLILPHDNALVLNLIHFKDEIRDESDLGFPSDSLKNYKISDREIKMAVSLIEDMSNKWEPEKYHDDYREALQKWLDSKTEELSKSPRKAAKKQQKDDVVDFISLLKKSMGKKSKENEGSSRKKTSAN